MVSAGTSCWDCLTPIWGDGEHVGGPPQGADSCPATITAECNILHLGREETGADMCLGRCGWSIASGCCCHLQLRLFLHGAAHAGVAHRFQRTVRDEGGCERG